MKIGIIGTGNMGRALGARWAEAGHEVLFGSRDRRKAESMAAGIAFPARVGDFDDAADFGEVVLYTVRGIVPSKLLRNPRALDGKVVIDCNNRDWGDDAQGYFRFDRPIPIPTLSEQLAADVPAARVVKAFSSLPQAVIERRREQLAAHHVSVFLCSDDDDAKAIVKRLAEDLGFVGVDAGRLEHGRIVDGVADFVRFQIVIMNASPLATLSFKVLPNG